MKPFRNIIVRWIGAAGACLLLVSICSTGPAQSTNNTATNSAEADKAWKEVMKAAQPPFPPAEWQQKAPTKEEQAAFYVPIMVKAADKAKDFYTRYPEHSKAAEARKKEFSLLNIAAGQFGDTSQTARLAELGGARLKDPKLTETERKQIEDSQFRSRIAAVQKLMRGMPDTADELEKMAHDLHKEFPKREEPYEILMMLAESSSGEKSTALIKDIIAGDAPAPVKESARGLLKRLEAVGKPVNIKFKALDGRQVDVTQMKDKVVLIDFWATWCGPCVGELPNVKAAYEKLHPKGFEIVSISFDESKDALEKFVGKQQMEWPQYFDGKGWGNKYGTEFGIHSIPTMWLVDKKGNLRDVNARGELEEKVSKLLAE